MKCKIASFFTVVLIIGVYLLFATISYAANEEVDPLFNEFLRDHPYEYAGLIDLDEDGRDEMLVASTHFEFDWHHSQAVDRKRLQVQALQASHRFCTLTV